jgi:gamma-glutamyltranspeptidase/glutathione hydrolase
MERTVITRSLWRPMKDEVVVDHAAVVTSHPLASEVGIKILHQGGNAVDAAVAIGFCLAVVEPMGSCIAGHGQMIIHMADQGGSNWTLDYSHRAPKAATAEMYRVLNEAEEGNAIYEVEGQANISGYRSVGVPGTTAGLCKAHELFGTLALEHLLEPAIHYADEGFQANWWTTLSIAEAMADFVKYGGAAEVFLLNGYPPRSAVDKIAQRDLGHVLRRIAREGKDALYKGEIPHAIEEDMKKNRGLLTAEDFSDYEVQIKEPIRIAYRGYETLGVPAPCGCATALQTFNILENFDLGSLGHNSPDYLHLFIEAARHAFADRYRYLGDPDFVPVPLAGILSKEYAKEIAEQIDKRQAVVERERTHQPWVAFADEALHDPWHHNEPSPSKKVLPGSPPGVGDCTTHFGVIDNNRNMVSCTQTAAGSFGSRVVTPGTGILFSNAMAVFNPKPGTANSIGGFKRALNNMTPLLVLQNGKPFLSVGAPGGRKIISCNTQVVTNVLDHKMGIQEAIAAPRMDASERETHVDARMDTTAVEALRKMGHNVIVVEESAAYHAGFARPSGLMLNPETGRIHAGVDVFRIGDARGF